MNFDSCGDSIYNTTFVVLDLETTGIDPNNGAITEFAAQKICAGEIISTMSILVNPQQKIPRRISLLNGLTNEKLDKYPTIDELLPTIIEFIGNNTIVGHNVRFDISFLNASLKKFSYEPLNNKFFDTLRLAKKLLNKEVRNYKLSTLSAYINTQTQPTHRALDDVKATTELFHYLIERSSSLGISGINDLASIPSANRRASFIKRKLIDNIPNEPGVYFFINKVGSILYIGKSINLKNRLRTYFSNDERTKVLRLIKETTSIEYLTTRDEIHARIAELRLIRHFQPEYNVADKGNRKMHYIALDENDPAPYLRITSSLPKDTSFALGPFNRRSDAEICRNALISTIGIRNCTNKCIIGKRASKYSCLSSRLNNHSCFCFDEWEGIEQYRLSINEKLLNLYDNQSFVTNSLLKKMQLHSQKLEFEKASTCLHNSQIFQKWMYRFSLVNMASNFSIKTNELNVIEGLLEIEPKNPSKSSLIQNCIDELNMIKKNNQNGFLLNNLFYISSTIEFVERYYLASFLNRNNLLYTKLSA